MKQSREEDEKKQTKYRKEYSNEIENIINEQIECTTGKNGVKKNYEML